MANERFQFSKKQRQVLTWWRQNRWQAIICDGAVRSGKTFCMGLSFFLWAQISPETMIGVFSKDTSILEAGIPFFRTCSFDYLAVLFVFSMNGYLNGRGKTIFTMISCCFGALALRIPLLVLACRLMPDSLGIIGAVAPTVSAVMAVYTCIYVLRCRNVTRV